MPSRNVVKEDVPDTYYHVYARGASKQPIFLEAADYQFFISLFARYLSSKPGKDKSGLEYPHFSHQIELLAYCLMGNHFHLLLYQVEPGAMAGLMRCVLTSYSRYFNWKYKRSGALFESRYKASRIDADNYLQHISRYIHLNPRYWRRYLYSSLNYYANGNEPEWLQTARVLDIFAGRKEYLEFVADYEEQRDMLEQIKHELADD